MTSPNYENYYQITKVDERVNMLDECMKFLDEVGEEMNMLLNWE